MVRRWLDHILTCNWIIKFQNGSNAYVFERIRIAETSIIIINIHVGLSNPFLLFSRFSFPYQLRANMHADWIDEKENSIMHVTDKKW